MEVIRHNAVGQHADAAEGFQSAHEAVEMKLFLVANDKLPIDDSRNAVSDMLSFGQESGFSHENGLLVVPKSRKFALFSFNKSLSLFTLESKARKEGLNDVAREELRQQESRPILEQIKERLDRDLSNQDILPSSPLGKAIRYATPLWAGLERYAQDGHGMVEIDNNQTENAIRPTAIGKKNWLFIGHPKAGQTSAIIYTIVENCRMWGIDPMEYLLDVMPRVMDTPTNRVAELLPRAWLRARENA